MKGVSQDVDRLFYEYSWPGNVRELENVIERAMILCPNDIIAAEDLPKGFKSNVDNALHLDGIAAGAKLYETLEMVEKTMIERALKLTNNVQSHAADILGIGKSGLNQKIQQIQPGGGPAALIPPRASAADPLPRHVRGRPSPCGRKGCA
ncbi:MAG: hypothetical protein MZV70_40330 [Desulfobacterales bacterium]|nr:hypothetical protein [Desulfobacterales bacterium]